MRDRQTDRDRQSNKHGNKPAAGVCWFQTLLLCVIKSE